MKPRFLKSAGTVFVLLAGMGMAQAQDGSMLLDTAEAAQMVEEGSAQFSGDVKLACDALLCLSSGSPPSECTPALRKFFSFSGKKMFTKRQNFLDLCPTATSSPEMKRLANDLVDAAGQCSPADLNQSRSYIGGSESMMGVISNRLPPSCASFYANPIISTSDFDKPVYVGTPEKGGYWVSSSDYPAAVADYNRQLQEAYEKSNLNINKGYGYGYGN